MADRQMEAMLKSDVNIWNKWRAMHSDATPNLSGALLCGVDLIRANLSGTDLRKADLRGANLSGAVLKGANLEGANFFKTILDHADVTGANLLGAQYLTPEQLLTCHNWQSASRDLALACGAEIPPKRL